MARLTWGAVGERTYEAGVDRGVLYVDTNAGVPWDGLISVNEEPTGGDVTAFHVDGVNHFNRVANEEFAATIEAFAYPEEFNECDGIASVKGGLFAAQQKRKQFGIVYRTKIGNDVNGLDYAYKIHLVYDAVTQPSGRSNITLSSDVNTANFSWSIVTKPPVFNFQRPTAHYVLDSRSTSVADLQKLEDILYGSASSTPRLPRPHEMVYIFTFDPNVNINAGQFHEPHYAVYDGGASPTQAAVGSGYDAGSLTNTVVVDPLVTFYDGGNPPTEIQTATIEGGSSPTLVQSDTIDGGAT